MGWAVGYDPNWRRDIGYGVPAICDHPGCNAEIHRGLAYVCGGDAWGGEDGCGLFFCSDHMFCNDEGRPVCQPCRDEGESYKPTRDTAEWLRHKLNDPTWADWRDAEPEAVAAIREALGDVSTPLAGEDGR